MSSAPLLERLRADPGLRIGDRSASVPDADRVVAAIEEALSDDGRPDPWRALDAVADLHDPETLDAVLSRVVRRGPFAVFGRSRGRRIRDVARLALAQTAHPGTVRLAAALLGTAGTDADVPALETIGAHPAFTLYGATALAERGSHAAIGALLRLLRRTGGAARVLVIDRLLVFVIQPAVRLALVRDAFVGLDDDVAREIARAVGEAVNVADLVDDPDAPEEVRAGAARILELAGPPHDLVE